MKDYLQINLIQHFAFCKRQWGLIALEQVWAENEDTVLGQFVHRNVDDEFYREKRRDSIFVRSMPISSQKLMLNGIADLVEYRKSKDGISLENYEGKWQPFIVEYKKGKPKKDDCDVLQLTAQVICLEEMTGARIDRSAIYYKSINKRVSVEITHALRERVIECANEMHWFYERKQTPKAERGKNCSRCSLKELCVPRLTTHKKSVQNYIDEHIRE